jgi:hypothetical protein
MMPGFSQIIRGESVSITHRYQNRTFEQALPRILRVIFVASVQKNRPLITGNGHLTTSQFFLHPMKDKSASNKYMCGKGVLRIRPIHSCGAKKSTGAFVVKTAIHLDISGERRIERLSTRDDPIKDGTLKTFRVVRSCTRHAFLNLSNQ